MRAGAICPGRLGRRTLLTTLLAAPAYASTCPASTRTTVTSVPLRLVDGYPLVPASIAGQPVSLLLDTGAERMLITPATAEALHLPLRGMTRIFGTGGSQEARIVLLPGLRLGGAAMPEQVSPVAPLPIALDATPPLAGLLGASVVSQFDLDLDVPGGRVTLSLPDGCAPPFAGTTLPLERTRAGAVFLPVRVNGQMLLALLDTGSRATLLTLDTARRLRLDAPISANTARGVDGERLPLGHVRVRMGLGGGPDSDTPVSISPLQLDRGDMLLGLDVLGRQRVFVGYARGEVTFGPAAGPAP